jgi:hypothetical protein
MFPPAQFLEALRGFRSLYASRTNTEKQWELPLPVAGAAFSNFVAPQKCDILSVARFPRIFWAVL